MLPSALGNPVLGLTNSRDIVTTAQKLVLALVLITLASVAVAGYILDSLHRNAVQSARTTLTTVAEQKRLQVERLLDDMREDLTLFSVGVAPMAKMITDWVEGGQQDEALRTKFSSRLQEIAKAHHHASIAVFDKVGHPLITIGNPPGRPVLDLVKNAFEQQVLQFVDLHETPDQRVEFGMMMPVMPQGRSPIAALYFGKVAEDQLYPALTSWPIPTDTGESLLAVRQGEEVVLASPLRNQEHRPLSFRLPLTNTALPAAQALRGKTGFITEAVDYRQEPVMAVATPIQFSPWFMMTKLDSHEVLADFRKVAALTVCTSLITLGLIYLAAYLVWRLDEKRRSLASTTKSLATTEERLRFALDATSDGLWDWRTHSGEAFCNPAFFSMLGYPTTDHIPDFRSRFLELLHPDDRESTFSAGRLGFASSGHFEMEFRLLGQDGQYRWILSRGQVVDRDEAGKPLRVVGTHIDITERKQAEQAVRELNANLEAKVEERTAELASANAAKSEFLAMMSHEIRTPMNAVLGLAQLLQQEPLESEQMAMVRHIREAGDTLLHLINDILDFSKIEAGQMNMDMQPFQLSAVVEHVDRLLRPAATSKGLYLQFEELPVNLGPLVSDALRLEQVLINLTSNAIKFTQKGGVAVKIVSQGSDDPTRALLRFEVRDTGIGINQEALGSLFQAFNQADSGITRRFGGTGLGLAISKRIVEILGGKIGVESQEGRGSTFWFVIPFEKSEIPIPSVASLPSGESPAESNLTGLRVLVVDDSQINLMVLERALLSLGVKVTLAKDGLQALQVLRDAPGGFDLVLMDVQMLVMDGLTATREIRQDKALAALPVIALTAGVLPEEQQAALAAGVNAFLSKPLDFKQMQELLSRIR